MPVIAEKNVLTFVSFAVFSFLPQERIPRTAFVVLSMGRGAPHMELAPNTAYTFVVGHCNILSRIINLRPCDIEILVVVASSFSLPASNGCTSILG